MSISRRNFLASAAVTLAATKALSAAALRGLGVAGPPQFWDALPSDGLWPDSDPRQPMPVGARDVPELPRLAEPVINVILHGPWALFVVPSRRRQGQWSILAVSPRIPASDPNPHSYLIGNAADDGSGFHEGDLELADEGAIAAIAPPPGARRQYAWVEMTQSQLPQGRVPRWSTDPKRAFCSVELPYTEILGLACYPTSAITGPDAHRIRGAVIGAIAVLQYHPGNVGALAVRYATGGQNCWKPGRAFGGNLHIFAQSTAMAENPTAGHFRLMANLAGLRLDVAPSALEAGPLPESRDTSATIRIPDGIRVPSDERDLAASSLAAPADDLQRQGRVRPVAYTSHAAGRFFTPLYPLLCGGNVVVHPHLR